MQQQKKFMIISAAIIIGVLAVYYADIALDNSDVVPNTTDDKSVAPDLTSDSTDITLNEQPIVAFSDVKSQSPEFLAYYESISLTPKQEALKEEVLSSMTAPCCVDPLSTCCCDCNLAKTVWGLANYQIVNGYDAEQLEDSVSQWLHFTNPEGYSGVGCYEGRCELPFEQDGCGGMQDLVLGD